MEAITLEQVYYLGQTVAAAALVISLIFVSLQLRQNTNAVRLSTLHDVKDTYRDIHTGWSRDAEMADIVFRGMQDVTSVSGNERLRFYTTMETMFLGFENIYYQMTEGALEPRHWSGAAQQMIDITKLVGVHAFWQDRKHWYSEDFQKYIDETVIPTPSAHYKMAGT